ncbi:MAG: hypothetical protein ACI8P9_003841 [Parasphingorhabdus sp.]|jgi:hypothetical protein
MAGSDPNNPHEYLMTIERSDEWGDIVRAFNRMLKETDIQLGQISSANIVHQYLNWPGKLHFVIMRSGMDRDTRTD